MNLRAYLLVVKNTWEETVAYRFNFVMWRLRVVLQILTLYFLWLAIIPNKASIFGYDQSQILTYILGTSIFSSVILSTRSHEIGEQINRGDLSNFLLRPINYFFYWFARDLGDKAMNILFATVELTILFFILRPPLIVQLNLLFIIFTFISAVLALILYFLFNILLGFLGFWSPETWAPRFIFMTVISFFAGGLFPLDILPKAMFSVFQLLPFPYLLYFPLKVYLGKMTLFEMSNGIFISVLWILVLHWMAKLIWLRGLRLYTAQGR
ncbi:MAG: ABC-2 family transporter protein [Candidatus Levybacteria bacterium]|nr:ABC-2 family transporter protein [Candidatus Levybacteria bacterium]MBI3069946.1 ABC-2 family transporter protein [Candidatus Levybacteria bacterium]